jgi:hypothetical protein
LLTQFKAAQSKDEAKIKQLQSAVQEAIKLVQQDRVDNAISGLDTVLKQIGDKLLTEYEKGERKLGETSLDKIVHDLHVEVVNIKQAFAADPEVKRTLDR